MYQGARLPCQGESRSLQVRVERWTRKGDRVEPDQSDVAVLVGAAAQGDEAAWSEIVDRFTPLLIAVVMRYRLSSGELEDVAQTVWLRLIEHLGELREPRALPMWLTTTAKREALRSAMAGARVQPADPQDERWSSRLATDDDPDAALVRSERHTAVLEGFATLSPRQRQLLSMLSEDPPVPYADISRRTGIPIGAIGPTRARALERLRRSPSVRALATTTEAEPSWRKPS
jgi:RNA polymerase sigma factor (sigma-70 family)